MHLAAAVLAATIATAAASADILVVRSSGPSAKNFPPGKSLPEAALSGIGTPQRRARIGAVRSVGVNQPKNPNIWRIDIAKSSNVCLADPANVVLWRADATQPVTLTVSGKGATKAVAWPAGESLLAWPDGLPISDGADYRLSWGAAGQTSLKFKTLPGKPVGLEEMASSLIRNDCQAQLDLLIETVKVPESGAAPIG